MSLWVDKHRPKSLDKLDLHLSLNARLKQIGSSPDLPHLLFCGPAGAGKQTRIQALLEHVFGAAVEKKKIDFRPFETSSGKKIELQIVSSNHHIEMNPSDAGIYDRVIVQEIVKEIASTQQVGMFASAASTSNAHPFKVLVIHEAESLSKEAQHALRRTMERYMRNMRIILCCENGGAKIIAPVKSRCLVVRVNAPSFGEVVGIMQEIAKREQLGTLPVELFEFIANAAAGNLRRALLMLEAAKAKASSMQVKLEMLKHGEIPLADWEVAVKEIAFMMIEEQSTGNLLKIRGKLYELLSHCIPASVILSSLVKALVLAVDQELKVELFADAAHYDCCIQQGQKAIFHLEAFVAKFMCSYKKFIGQMVDE